MHVGSNQAKRMTALDLASSNKSVAMANTKSGEVFAE